MAKGKSINLRNEPTIHKHISSPYFEEKLDFCKNHSDEIKTYFCFTCSNVICPECAIHGSHIGHEVEVIKKAGGKLKGMFNQYVLEAQRSSTLLSGYIKEVNNSI